MQRITVAIADWECAAYAPLLRHQHDITLVAPTATSEDVVATAVRVKPRILLCSFELAVASGCSLLLALRQHCPETLVVLLSNHTIPANRLMPALAGGAVGILNRETLQFELSRAVRGVDGGQAWVSRKLLGSIFDRVFTPGPAEPDVNGRSFTQRRRPSP